jgi:hypothetical protein
LSSDSEEPANKNQTYLQARLEVVREPSTYHATPKSHTAGVWSTSNLRGSCQRTSCTPLDPEGSIGELSARIVASRELSATIRHGPESRRTHQRTIRARSALAGPIYERPSHLCDPRATSTTHQPASEPQERFDGHPIHIRAPKDSSTNHPSASTLRETLLRASGPPLHPGGHISGPSLASKPQEPIAGYQAHVGDPRTSSTNRQPYPGPVGTSQHTSRPLLHPEGIMSDLSAHVEAPRSSSTPVVSGALRIRRSSPHLLRPAQSSKRTLWRKSALRPDSEEPSRRALIRPSALVADI